MRLACTIVIVTLIGCNAVSGADGLSAQATKGAYKTAPKPSKPGKPPTSTTTSPTSPAGDDTPGDPPKDGGTTLPPPGTLDAGTTSTPTSTASVECGPSTVCRGTSPVCCDSAAASHCAAKGNCAGYFELSCDDAGDCPSGQVCCVNATNEVATCQTSCPSDLNAGRGLICKNDGQCPSGQTCAYGVTDDNNDFISDSWFFCGPPP